MDDETLKIYAYVSISSYRSNALKAIGDNEMTPTQIAKESGVRLNHISTVLKHLKDNNLAECINESDRKNRLYRLTETGKEILDYMER